MKEDEAERQARCLSAQKRERELDSEKKKKNIARMELEQRRSK